MQTFLPYSSFRESATCLDYRRLCKQRVEAFQLLLANGDPWAMQVRTERKGLGPTPKGWVNHPAARMWRGYNLALSVYMNTCIEEWIRRGYKNTMTIRDINSHVQIPYWIGNSQFHASHRSNLIRKDPVYYGKFGWEEDNSLPYIWPV